MAVALREFAKVGVTHLQVWLDPTTVAGIEEFAATLDLLDQG
jgi:hypothetical protein